MDEGFLPSSDRKARRPRVIVAGAGFAGLSCVRALAGAPADVILIDRTNHHCFQPLLYQVATAALAPNDVAWPIRAILRGQANAQTLMGEIEAVDAGARRVRVSGRLLAYDWLVLATGATHSYFGRDEWAAFAPGLKRIEDATALRRKILLAFERAELALEPEVRQRLLTFVVIGGGPTGVELAGAIAEIARGTLHKDFRRIDPASARIVLVEAGPRILNAYPEDLAAYAARALERRGVEVMTGTAVTGCDGDGVATGFGRIEAATLIWAAGVKASPAAQWLGVAADRVGRVAVGPDLTAPGAPGVFVIGDASLVVGPDDKPAPGIAPAAKQMGRYAARVIAAAIAGRPAPPPFRYRHAGDFATIGRNAAVVRMGAVKLTGFPGWLTWSAAHVWFLIGARNRIAVAFNWLWDYVTFQRGVRLITEPAPLAARADARYMESDERVSR